MPMAGSRRSPRKSSVRTNAILAAALVLLPALLPVAARPVLARASPQSYKVVGDAIPRSLTGRPGDPQNGRRIVADRRRGLCLLCHSGPFPEQPLQGNLAPDLAGASNRWTEGQLRLRIVDADRALPGTIIPSYYRPDRGIRISPAFAGKPILDAEQIEDVVAFLATLR